MRMRSIALLLGLLMAFPASAGQCSAKSGELTAALVELYTSEGCDSCPPADRWLSSLGTGSPAGRVVPLSLHVDYWDYIGWKDPYAKREFSNRQRKFTQLQKAAFVYTPQVMLQGSDFRGWGSPAFDQAVAQINARKARARLELAIVSLKADKITLQMSAEVPDAADRGEAGVYVATYENKLSSAVTAGENKGHTLVHDYVVLEWQGPAALPASGLLTERRELPLLPKAVPANSGVVAFVQNRRTGEVLQALMLPACPG
jgi:hypothetical protein